MTSKAVWILLLATLPTACDPAFSVCVKVTSCEDADPIVGARVQFSDYRAESYTEPDGVACYGDVGELPETLEIVVEKPGYQLETARVETPGGAGDFDTAVCLTPDPAADSTGSPQSNDL